MRAAKYILAALLGLCTGCCGVSAGPAGDGLGGLDIVVFRHHPGMMDIDPLPDGTNPSERDAALVFEEASKAGIGLRDQGGMGRGFEADISARDLPRWKALIDRLMAEQRLYYYTSWGFDHHGYGFVTVR